jgi:hypothetical protein
MEMADVLGEAKVRRNAPSANRVRSAVTNVNAGPMIRTGFGE